MIVIRDPKTFYLTLGDENLKHKIEFIIKSFDSLPKKNIKKRDEEFVSKYKH